jgi:hypothetical protein
MDHRGRPAAASTAGNDDQSIRLVLGLLPLVFAGCLGYVMNGVLVMGADSCTVTSTQLICSTTVQYAMMWLSPVGAVTGIVAGATLGIRRVRRKHAPRGALLLGWTTFAIAELTALVLQSS